MFVPAGAEQVPGFEIGARSPMISVIYSMGFGSWAPFVSCCFPPGKLILLCRNLVDSASSHTLVSKIKPCMSKYKSSTLKLRTAHYISYNLLDSPLLLG